MNDTLQLTFIMSSRLYQLALTSIKLFDGANDMSVALMRIVGIRLHDEAADITLLSADDVCDYLTVSRDDKPVNIKIEVSHDTSAILEKQKVRMSSHLSKQVTISETVAIILVDYIIEKCAITLTDAIENNH